MYMEIILQQMDELELQNDTWCWKNALLKESGIVQGIAFFPCDCFQDYRLPQTTTLFTLAAIFSMRLKTKLRSTPSLDFV